MAVRLRPHRREH